MAPILLTVGGGLFALLGLMHGVFTLRSGPDGGPMAPTDASVRAAMQRVGGLGLEPKLRTTLWRAWVGFNLSHSLGVLLFGLALPWLAWTAPATIWQTPVVIAVCVVVPAAYLVLSIRYWFAKPTQAIALALGLIYAGLILSLL